MKIHLIHIMPKSGFTWSRGAVTTRHAHDARIQTAFRNAGHRFDKSHVIPLLVDALYHVTEAIEEYQAPASSFSFGGMDLSAMGIGPEDMALGLEDLGVDPAAVTTAAGPGEQQTGGSGLITLFDAIKKAHRSIF